MHPYPAAWPCRPGWGRRRSGRPGAGMASAGGPCWHHFPGDGAPGGDHDEFPVPRADREGPGVSLLENAQHVGHLLAVSRSWAPADHDPLADIGAGQPDLQPVPHTCHLLGGPAVWAAGQPAGRLSTRALSLTPVRGSAIAYVTGGSPPLATRLLRLPGFGLRVWSA